MLAIPRQHRGATPVSSSTTSLELSRLLTSKITVVIVEVEGELSGRTQNAHNAQLAGEGMESNVGDVRLEAKPRDTRYE